MDIDSILSKLDVAWQDVSHKWRDEYATRYKNVVIQELETTLNSIKAKSSQLEDSVHDALTALRVFDE